MPDKQGGGYFLTRYDDVRGILSDLSLWRDPCKAGPESRTLRPLREPAPKTSLDAGNSPCSIIFLDDPDHARIRAPLALAFNSRVKQMRPRIQAIVETRLDQIERLETFDAISEYALPIPVHAIADIIGVEMDRLAEFRKWSEDLAIFMHPARSASDTSRMIEAQNSAHRYFLALLSARRAEPKDDLASDIVGLQALGAPITDHEVQANFRVLLTAGNLTTTDMIGNAIWLLLSNPEQLEKLRSGKTAISAVVEEALRMEPPIDLTFRVASREFAIRDHQVAPTQVVTLSLRGANRDPDAFPDPHQFNVDRIGRPHVSFGGGAHLCLGSALARMEIQIAIEALFRRLPNLRLEESPTQSSWRAFAPFRGLKELRLRI